MASYNSTIHRSNEVATFAWPGSQLHPISEDQISKQSSTLPFDDIRAMVEDGLQNYRSTCDLGVYIPHYVFHRRYDIKLPKTPKRPRTRRYNPDPDIDLVAEIQSNLLAFSEIADAVGNKQTYRSSSFTTALDDSSRGGERAPCDPQPRTGEKIEEGQLHRSRQESMQSTLIVAMGSNEPPPAQQDPDDQEPPRKRRRF